MKDLSDIKIILIGLVIAIIFSNIFLLSSAFSGLFFKINAENASQYGSFIGGYIGTTLSFLSIILLYLTLRSQNQSYNEQSKSAFIEKFENNFFEMIKLHRENVLEIEINNAIGRKVFVVLLREFREIILLLNDLFQSNSNFSKINIIEKYDIAYCVLFYG